MLTHFKTLHYSQIHLTGPFPCRNCNEEIDTYFNLREHEKICIVEPIEVNEEPIEVKDEPSEVKDEPVEVNDEPVDFEYDEEDEVEEVEFFDENELFTRKVFYCPLCDVRGWSEDKIHEHMKEFHNTNNKWKVRVM